MWPSSFPFSKPLEFMCLASPAPFLKAWADEYQPFFYCTIPSNNLCQIHQLIGVYVAKFHFLKSLHLTEGLFSTVDLSLCLETLLSFGFSLSWFSYQTDCHLRFLYCFLLEWTLSCKVSQDSVFGPLVIIFSPWPLAVWSYWVSWFKYYLYTMNLSDKCPVWPILWTPDLSGLPW